MFRVSYNPLCAIIKNVIGSVFCRAKQNKKRIDNRTYYNRNPKLLKGKNRNVAKTDFDAAVRRLFQLIADLKIKLFRIQRHACLRNNGCPNTTSA